MPETIYEDGRYLEANPTWHVEDAPFKSRWIKALLDEYRLAPTSVAEVGCGSGEVLIQLADQFPTASYFGYDVSPQAYAINSQKKRENVSFHLTDFLTSISKKTDLLLAIDVIEHVDDYLGFIRGLKGRSSYTIFHIPLDLSVQGLLRGKAIMHSRRTVGHLHYFYKETALATLRDCGFEIIGWNYTHGAEELPGRALRTRLLKYPRRLLRWVHADFAVRCFGGASMMILVR